MRKILAPILCLLAWPALGQVSNLPANTFFASPSGTTGPLSPRTIVSSDVGAVTSLPLLVLTNTNGASITALPSLVLTTAGQIAISGFTANLPIIGNGASGITQGTRSGNTTAFATASGSLVNGDCVSIDASGNFVDAGGPCTTGGGGGTVSSGTIHQLAVYAATGTTVSGLATANSGVLITSSGGTPSIATTLPGSLTIPSPTFSGTVAGSNTVPLTILAQSGANTMLGNWTGSTANVAANSMPSCSAAGDALIYTSGTGITCNTAITAAAMNLGTATLTGTLPYTNIPVASAANYLAATASKILDAADTWTAAAETALTPGSTVALDLSSGVNFSLAIGANATLSNPSNGKQGQQGYIRIAQPSSGGPYTLAYDTAYKWQGGTAGVLSTGASQIDYLFYAYHSSTEIVLSLGNNYQ